MKKLFALLFISMISGMIMAQIPEVSGTIVFKKDGQPVVGALVSVLGTDISTITDVDGRFILKEIPEKAQRIRVKYIGMQPKDVKIRPIMNVTLDLEKKLAFFIQAGVGVSGYNLENNNEDIYGGNNHLYIQGGVGLNYNFSTYFSLQPSVNVVAKGCKNMGRRGSDGQGEITVDPVYLEIPVLIAARFIISDFGRLIFNAGPYAAIGIAGKGKYTDEWEGTSMKFDLFSGDEAFLKRFDAGVQAGFAYEIKHIGFSYTFGYGLLKPFKEWNKEWGATPHNISHNFGLKYIF